jgi:predicted nucleic acid-binding protein
LRTPLYVSNDLLFHEAFRLASTYQMALYDTLYVALADALDIPFVTTDQRLFNLAKQRGVALVRWFEDVAPSAIREGGAAEGA